MLENKRYIFFDIILSLFIISIPIIQRGYELGMGLYFFIIMLNLLVCIILLLSCRGKIHRKRCVKVIIFLGTLFILNTVSMLQPYGNNMSSTSTHNLMIFVDAIIIFGAITEGVLNSDIFIKIYDICAKLAIVFLFIQVIMFYGMHVIISGKIPFLELQADLFDRSVLTYASYARFSSFFIEPSYYAQFIAPYLAIVLYGYKSIVKQNFLWAIIVSGSMILNVSGTSVVILAIVWSTYILFEIGKMSRKKAIGILVLIVLLVIAAIFALNMPGVNAMISGLTDSSSHKTLNRVTRGFVIFKDLPLYEKIFGIGFQNISNTCDFYNISEGNIMQNGNNEYCNDIGMLLLSFGILGVMILFILFKNSLKVKQKNVWIVWIAIASIFASEVTLGYYWLFLMSIGYCVKTNSEIQSEKVMI